MQEASINMLIRLRDRAIAEAVKLQVTYGKAHIGDAQVDSNTGLWYIDVVGLLDDIEMDCTRVWETPITKLIAA